MCSAHPMECHLSYSLSTLPSRLHCCLMSVLSLMALPSPRLSPAIIPKLPFPSSPRLTVIRSSSSSSSTNTNPNPNPNFDLRHYWSNLLSEINTSLSAAIPVSFPDSIHLAMRHSVLSPAAKRAPPILCLAAACDLLGTPLAAALPTACALEMVHSASLVHDDLPCMDASPTRRGRPSSHSLFGEALAVLAGDALFPLAFDHITSQTPSHLVSSSTVLAVVSEISRAVGSSGMAGGQFLDLSGMISGADVVLVLEKKFGEMAECSAACGGILGGAGKDEVARLRKYGRAMGVLYQLVDDVLMEEHRGGNGKMRSNASVVKVLGMDRALEMVEEMRKKAKRELEEGFGVKYGDRLLPLYSFVDYAVERGFDVSDETLAASDDNDAIGANNSSSS